MRRIREREDGVSLIELLVVMIIMGVISSAVFSVVLSMNRTEQFQSEMQEVMDDGRLSLSRIRKELRGARRVLAPNSNATSLHFWVDQNQDSIPQSAEYICYATEALPGGTAGQYRIVRWANATPSAGCGPGLAGTNPIRVVAETLTNNTPFALYTPVPSTDINQPPTRTVKVVLSLEVLAGRDTTSIEVDTTVRLRNVA